MLEKCSCLFLTGQGKPVILRDSNNLEQVIDPIYLPSCDEAVQVYENLGGRLTMEPHFREDPLNGDQDLQTRRELLWLRDVPDVYDVIYPPKFKFIIWDGIFAFGKRY